LVRTLSRIDPHQPVYTRSAGRWRDYAPYLPALLRISER
jgi:hypothetical protein